MLPVVIDDTKKPHPGRRAHRCIFQALTHKEKSWAKTEGHDRRPETTAHGDFNGEEARVAHGGLPLRKGRLAARPPLLDLNSSRPLWTDLNPDSSLDF